MSDPFEHGSELFVAPPAAAPPAAPPVLAPPRQTIRPGNVIPDPRWALNPETFRTTPVTGRLPGWANAGIAMIAVALIGGLIAALAVPIVAAHRRNSQFDATSINAPASFNGMRGVGSQQSEQQLASTAAGFASTSLRIYGKKTPGLILIIGFRPQHAMSDDDQAAARTRFAQELNTGASKLTLRAAKDAGVLGGYFGCGKAAPATVCVGTDAGSMVAIVLGPTVAAPESVALKARQATVSRS